MRGQVEAVTRREMERKVVVMRRKVVVRRLEINSASSSRSSIKTLTWSMVT
jgi:hypothetical protein